MNQPKHALITGGATRVGRVLTEHFAKHLDTVTILYNTSQKEAFELKEKYPNVRLIKCNLLNKDDLDRTIKKIKSTCHIQLLINNASIMPEATIQNCNDSCLLNTFQLHVFAPWKLTQAFSSHLNHVINILDIKINTNQNKRSAYLLSKKTLAEFTKMAALEYAPNIKINGIAIGWIFDPIGLTRSENEHNAYLDKIPLKIKVSENDLTTSVDYIIKSNQTTGQIINLAGGKELVF